MRKICELFGEEKTSTQDNEGNPKTEQRKNTETLEINEF
jgi:hypothetical protein